MGHHLVVFAHGPEDSKRWVINLRDNSVQTPWGFSFGAADDKYSLTQFGKNQIIKFGGEEDRKATNELVLMTIDSFDRKILLKYLSLITSSALRIRSEVIQHKNAPKISGHTAVTYQDCLFVFGGRSTGRGNSPNYKLWCYDLSILSLKALLISSIVRRTWKQCDTIGEGPDPKDGAKSWIKDDKLYVYGGLTRNSEIKVNYSELFELNLSKRNPFSTKLKLLSLESMKWRKIEQSGTSTPGQDSTFFERLSTDIYGDNLLILKNETKDESDQLYCCNRSRLSRDLSF